MRDGVFGDDVSPSGWASVGGPDAIRSAQDGCDNGAWWGRFYIVEHFAGGLADSPVFTQAGIRHRIKEAGVERFRIAERQGLIVLSIDIPRTRPLSSRTRLQRLSQPVIRSISRTRLTVSLEAFPFPGEASCSCSSS